MNEDTTYPLAIGIGRVDVNSRTQDINSRTIIGTPVSRIVLGSATDSADRWLRSRRVVIGIGVVVTSGDSYKIPILHESASSIVGSLAVATTKRHVDDNAVGAVALGYILLDVVHAGNDVGVLALVVVFEHLDAVDVDFFGNAICLAANSARDVSSVAVVVDIGALNE